MKKTFAVLTALVMVFALACAVAEESDFIFTYGNNITFGMSSQEVIAAETAQLHDRDQEHTRGPVTFDELEYEDTAEDGSTAETKYLFVADKLVAIRLEQKIVDIPADDTLADLTGLFGEPVAFDAALLGNGIYAVDDDGTPEANVTLFIAGNMAVVVEVDDDGDDIDITFMDLTADYIK